MDIYSVQENAIVNWKNEAPFLSNMFEMAEAIRAPFPKGDIEFYSSEAFYQALKFPDYDLKKKIANMNGYEAKKFAKQNQNLIQEDWEERKFNAMEIVINFKFERNTQPELCEMLLATGDRQIVELNWWNDRYWGVSSHDGRGLNKLGELLMARRSWLRNQ